MANADQDVVAEAVKTALNGESFSEAFTAVCGFRPRLDREDLSGLQVRVLGTERRREIGTQGFSRRELGVAVLVQSPVDPEDLAAVRSLNGFVQEVDDWLEGREMGGATYLSSELTGDGDPFDPELLVKHKQFEAVLQLTYQAHVEMSA